MMLSQINKHIFIDRWFYVFIAAHLFCWTIVPIMIRYNLPLDAIEGATWGHQLEWGYDKNPYLNGWLTALAVYLGGQSGWMVYLFSQVSVIACFWAVWRLARHMVAPAYAFISVLLLEGIQYYNLHAIDFNDNTLELGLWGLGIYFFYKATSKTDHATYLHWFLTGLFTGLGMMAKYYTAVLIGGMILFLVTGTTTRKQLSTLPPYLGLVAFLSVSLPHVIWLFSHKFITVTYVFARASSIPSWTNHVYFPAQFTWQQFEVVCPAIILFGLLIIGKKTVDQPEKKLLNKFDQRFLFYVGLSPFLLTIFLSLLLGIKLRAGWGMPLLSLWGLILVAYMQPAISGAKLSRFILFVFIFMGVLLTGYSISLIHSKSPSSANFPGHDVATAITKLWHDEYHTKLDYVAGSRWLGGNIAFYSPDHPAVFIEWNPQHAPWIDENTLREKGAVFVWEISANEVLPAEIQKQFPQLQKPHVMQFSLQRNYHQLPPIKIGIAVLPPNQKFNAKIIDKLL